jgi:hypothetical protein
VRVGIEVVVGAGFLISIGLAHRFVVVGALCGLIGVVEASLGVVELVRAARVLIGVVVAGLAATHLRAKIRAFAVGFMALYGALLCVAVLLVSGRRSVGSRRRSSVGGGGDDGEGEI